MQFRRIMFLAAGIVLTNAKIFSAMCVCDDCFVIAAAVQSSSLWWRWPHQGFHFWSCFFNSRWSGERLQKPHRYLCCSRVELFTVPLTLNNYVTSWFSSAVLDSLQWQVVMYCNNNEHAEYTTEWYFYSNCFHNSNSAKCHHKLELWHHSAPPLPPVLEITYITTDTVKVEWRALLEQILLLQSVIVLT